MWIITGPFDTEIGADLSFQKSKLLKTDKSYTLGRKNQPLLVASKKVSQEHCLFNVGEYTLDDVHNPDKRPKLEFVSKRDKGMRLLRGDAQLLANPQCMMELQDGDIIHIVTGLPISVKWQPICCYSPNLRGKSNISLETCSQLGMSIVYTPSHQVTHHIIPTYVANASIAASLISAAQFVKFDWLSEILKSADTLEDKFVLPTLGKHRPSFSPSLSPSQKVFKVWEPNEERLNMFTEYRFLVLGEKAREMEGDLRELIKRGGGFIETFDIAGGVAKLHKALTRGQAKEAQQLVVVADVKDVKAAIGHDEWKKLVAEVQSFGLHVTYPETIIQSVLDIEPALLTAQQPSPLGTGVPESNASLTSLPNCVPNSIPDEPSISPGEPPPKKRLSRRATSRQPSEEPTSQLAAEEIKTESPKHRRILLSRRARTVEPNDDAESSEKSLGPSSTTTPAAPPTTSRLRLKRRLGAVPETPNPAAQFQLPDLASSAAENEPPLKKFKALFEASDPTRGGVESFDEDVILGTGVAGTTISQTQSQTEGFVRRPATGSSLNALRDEEEESQATGAENRRGMKRTLDVVQEEDGDVEMTNAGEEGGEHIRKKQALDNVNSVERAAAAEQMDQSPQVNAKDKERNPGAPVGNPDTDVEFLKAVASTRKGKRTEDAFDREFNNLRISKPNMAGTERQQREEKEEEWRKFTDFGDDAGLRGNFMLVLEMSVYRKDKGKNGARAGEEQGSQAVIKGREVPEQWKDKPNFKKFKKKLQQTRGALVELVVSEDFDGAGPAPRRNKKPSQAQRTTSSFQMEIKTESQSMPRQAPSKNALLVDDTSDENEPPKLDKQKTSSSRLTTKFKPPSRAGSRAPSIRTMSNPPSRAGSAAPTRHATSKSSKLALFLDSDDDIEEVDELESQNNLRGDEEDDEDQTLRSSAAAKGPTGSIGGPKRAPTTNRRTKRAAATNADDDSDDGAVFKGFGAGKRKR